MHKLYRVKNWASQFENNRTKSMKVMQWIPVPNKHDGDGYTELVDRENGAEMLGAWLAILQVASKCGDRGTLLRENGTPHTPKSIARLTRLKEGVICEALDLLCHLEIGWLEVVTDKPLAGRCGETAGITHPTDEEGKGKEGNGIEEKEQNGGEGIYPQLLMSLQKNPNFTNAIACVYSCHDAFKGVQRFHIENALKSQPDKSRWAEAIEGMTRKFAGADMKFPVRSLENWLAGKQSDEYVSILDD